jgi:hypothetical protein
MRIIIILACILWWGTTGSAFGQQISETNLSLGFSKSASSHNNENWEDTSPISLLIGATKSWYGDDPDHRFSLRKEAGLHFQYANIDQYNGEEDAGNHYTGSITSLFATAALQARVRIYSNFAIGIGPEAEILLLGKNNLTNDYFSRLNGSTPTSGQTKNKALNRDYFPQPSFGIKFSLFETGINENTTIGINISHLWTKSELSNFYSSRYTRISLFIGFRKQEKVTPLDPQN